METAPNLSYKTYRLVIIWKFAVQQSIAPKKSIKTDC